MPSYKEHYRGLFEVLGYPLAVDSGTPAKEIEKAEKRLNVKIPSALRDYYLVAGREKRFSQCLNRLIAPDKWSIDQGRLIFMEENQAVVSWGIPTRNSKVDDPIVSQGINDDSITWHSERRRCSQFLSVMLHYHAVSGGYRCLGRVPAPETSNYRFEQHGWTYHGEVNSLSAYSRQNQVVCLMPPGDFAFMQNWMILAGGKSKSDLTAIGTEIGVKL